MTEAEWLSSDDPKLMFKLLSPASQRKASFFAFACCRRIDYLLTEKGLRTIEGSEQAADGIKMPLTVLFEQSPNWSTSYGNSFDSDAAVSCALRQVEDNYQFAASWAASASPDAPAEWKTQADFLRCIFGNPFRPVAFDPSWRTDTALTLAKQMYDSREFSPMPILADALQDAGCEQENILSHCRSAGPHVRGCWVVDLVLAKE